jgi:LysM repeat protein
MRPYKLVDETLDDDEDGYPRVVPVGASSRTRTSGGGLSDRHEPWTPRGTDTPTAPPRQAATPTSIDPSFTRTHRWMLFGFLIICVGMILGMVLVRVWDEASRAVAALPPEGTATASARPAAGQPAISPSAAQPAEASAPPSVGGAVTTEIRVLQPNYTVAPGETLGIIARKHGTSVDALASINNLENRNSLAVGQKLIIP